MRELLEYSGLATTPCVVCWLLHGFSGAEPHAQKINPSMTYPILIPRALASFIMGFCKDAQRIETRYSLSSAFGKVTCRADFRPKERDVLVTGMTAVCCGPW